MTGKRYIGLDLMRTAAVLFVLVCHSLIFLPFQKGKDFLFLYLGFIGVEIFFVLSGFLI
jgi:peptidoglycan/LPS O-acetylase OafA/YrhL